jgi:hypothetical protein
LLIKLNWLELQILPSFHFQKKSYIRCKGDLFTPSFLRVLKWRPHSSKLW